MKKAFTFLLFLFVFCSTNGFTQNSLTIVNPNWGQINSNARGTIEEAEIQIEPKGLYMEIGLFLTLSANGSGYEGYDNLEIVLDFNLPSGSIIHDSWLWMEDGSIVKADVFEINQGTEIYEDIVDRNLDPSLLFRKDNGNFQMRIFPLAAFSSRKVKITYLVPAIWHTDKVESWLPFDLLGHSVSPVESINIISLADEDWGRPVISSDEEIQFDSLIDPEMGLIWHTTLQADVFNKPSKFSVNNPMQDNLYVNVFEDNAEEKFYQIAYLPPELPATENPKNIAIIFDHDQNNTNVSQLDIYNYVQDNILSTLDEGDQINLFYMDGPSATAISDTWIPCDPASLDQLFSTFTGPTSQYSDFNANLLNAIDFIKNNGAIGEVIFLTSSSDLWNSQSIIEHVLDSIGEDDIKLHMISYQTLNYYWEYFWNEPDVYTFRNRDLCHDLAFLTGGDYYSMIDGGGHVWEAINSIFNDLKNVDYNFDLNIDVSSGFSFDAYYQQYQGQSTQLNQPILQTGKYLGDLPASIDFAGYNDGSFSFDTKAIDPGDIFYVDTLSREVWMGNHIRSLEGNVSSNADIADIVELSIAERVLSRYTAFLALEVSQGGEICPNCWYLEEIIIDTEDDLLPEGFEISVQAAPNPFSEYCQLSFDLKGEEKPDQLEVAIYDAYGKLIRTIDVSPLLDVGTQQITWDGRDANGQKLPSGIYHLIVRSEQQVQSFKLVLID